MRVCRVVGTVVATKKSAKLEGAKLLLVRPTEPLPTGRDEPAPMGPAIIAVDAAQAGVGDTVLVVTEGRAAASALGRRGAPVDAAIVGIVDHIDSGERETAQRAEKRSDHAVV
jgi:ethanolamine utilization protein EutN